MFRTKILTLFILCSPLLADESLERQFFENRIRPVLVEHCYECHSVESDSASGGLLLDSREGWSKGGDSGPAIVIGNSEASKLVEAIGYANRDLQMPPDNRLSDEIVSDFRKWIRDGAFDPRKAEKLHEVEEFDLEQRASEHWAWQPRKQPTIQSATNQSVIDCLVDRQLILNGLRRAPAATAETLIRRLTFDLIGLPPTPRQIQAFQRDVEQNRGEAIDSLIERLLSSPRFGEKWASHWFDVVDYSETKGHVTDQERPYAWKYRDYVIDALNNDVPYDQFVTEHIAGDLLPTGQQRTGHDGVSNVSPTATGTLFMHEMHFMAVDPVQQRWDEIDAQLDLVGKAFLGLTVECARCHDHKFDAISQADYYALAGFFYSTEQGKRRIAPRAEGDPSSALAKAEAEYEEYLAKKRAGRVAALNPKNASGAYFPISEELGIQTSGDTAQLLKRMRALEQLDPTWSHWVRAAEDANVQDVPLLIRGEVSNPGMEVGRRFLTAIRKDPPANLNGSGRLWLARQIADANNPLTARVYVNRVWHHLFGRGIVATPNDFGKLGDTPSHPQLLDYLAQRLIDSGWSTKRVIREIVESETYQQRSQVDAAKSKRIADLDPGNRWLSRQNRRRLNAEQMRDAMLFVAGSLDLTMYGPGIDPFVPPFATANKTGHIPKAGPLDGANRRSVYIKVRRNFIDPFLRTFDFPERGKPVGKRGITIAPNQALAMLNNPLVHELASDWGQRIVEQTREEAGADTLSVCCDLWTQGLGREPLRAELKVLGEIVAELDGHESLWQEIAHVVFNQPDFLWID